MTTTQTTATEPTTMTAYRARSNAAQERGDAEETRVLDLVYECATAAVAAQRRRHGRSVRFFSEPIAEDRELFADVLEYECAARGYPLR